ncbi:DUF952 domain-containing protein [Sphingobium sufflavum]|uniref:DUF952 domain-containing protein n=1 Tax=Sphingobium sufflavum TaxID=1129547 RepID=UPI001F37C923|nr:DUF952 domain-containing protein [Sphingobium sufflavum]MCE7797800.1 DUF952 domain-containing protein [Sphingobium sufflavum]
MTILFAYKLLDQPTFREWKDSGSFTGSPDDVRDGFIHLSTAAQTAETAAKYFSATDPLVVAMVDLAAVRETLKWEESRGGALFPHVYGAIPFKAVSGHSILRLGDDGRHVFPQGF